MLGRGASELDFSRDKVVNIGDVDDVDIGDTN